MRKLDLRKELRAFYSPSARKPELIDVPEFKYAMAEGSVRPGQSPGESKEFQQAIGALYAVSYTLKFMSKLAAERPIDYPVMPLEALWWTEGGEFDLSGRSPWLWRAMILQPAHITARMFRQAVQRAKERGDNPTLDTIRLRAFREGLCVQVLHIGPYSEEPATIERLKAFARENGYRLRGKHHEIYLGDPRRAKPERLRTILRHPVSPRR
ncbi:MAG: GyrI-like domain-containing protein [Chloroflexota bacterium]